MKAFTLYFVYMCMQVDVVLKTISQITQKHTTLRHINISQPIKQHCSTMYNRFDDLIILSMIVLLKASPCSKQPVSSLSYKSLFAFFYYHCIYESNLATLLETSSRESDRKGKCVDYTHSSTLLVSRSQCH